MDTDELIEKIDEYGVTEALKDEVMDKADELIDRLDELDDEVIEVILDNI